MLIYLNTCDAFANNAYSPNYNLFIEHLMLSAIFFVSIYVLMKIIIKSSGRLTQNKKIKKLLKSDHIEYIMMICLSTILFYIINGIFYLFKPLSHLSGYWVDAILIDAVIICLILFALDILLLEPCKSIVEYFYSTEMKFPTTRNNKDIYLGSFILAVLVISYSILFLSKQ